MNPLTFIHQNNSKNIVLFIHGFTGGVETWRNTSGELFPEFLKSDSDISENYDIACITYYSKFVDMHSVRATSNMVLRRIGRKTKATLKNVSIQELSDHLNSVVNLYCSSYENIVLVAHSMGGLVSKSYILEESKQSSPKVRMFLSLAVPHNGSDWANIGSKLSKGNPQVVDLKPLGQFLNGINNNWLQAKNFLPRTIYFYGQSDDIVEQTSAVAYETEKAEKVACMEDHLSIAKPESKDSMVYVGVKKFLLECIRDIQLSDAGKIKRFADDGSLDKELFVLKLLIADVHKRIIKDAKETFFNAEYTKTILTNLDIKMDELDDLYGRIGHLYSISFGKFVSGTLKTSNDLVTDIHEQIMEKDKDILKTTVPLIDAYRKTGMLHQLANVFDDEIWWAREKSINDLGNLRKAIGDE